MMSYFISLFFIMFALSSQAENLPPVTGNAAGIPDAAFIPVPSEAPQAEASAAPAAKPTSGIFSSKAGEDQLDITADKSLEWHEQERVYIATGHAKAKKGDVTIEADILKAYDRKKPDGNSEVWRLTAQGNVRVTGKTQNATGETAEYDIDTKKAILKGNNLSFTTDTDKVTARDSLEYWEVENRAIARGDALAIRQDRQVRADTLVAQFKKNTKGNLVSDSMTAKGNVHITSAKDAVICDEALYQVEANSAILTGNVFITQGTNQLKGDKVEANFKTGMSKIMNTGTGRVHALILSTQGKPSEIQKGP
jgi:lipopolysaccharide export system protein LptA